MTSLLLDEILQIVETAQEATLRKVNLFSTRYRKLLCKFKFHNSNKIVQTKRKHNNNDKVYNIFTIKSNAVI